MVKISPDILEEQIEIICKTLIQYKVSAITVSNTSAKNRDKLKRYSKTSKRWPIRKTSGRRSE